MDIKHAKPFLKWAGGKSQLLPEIDRILPDYVFEEPFTYIEPFVGSGAVLFWMLNNFPNMKRAVINDVNIDLINTYNTIAESADELIKVLSSLQDDYYSISDDEGRKKEYYYDIRNRYNTRNEDSIMQAALFIFLNKTCFNGLYRVNRNNEFNVPIGSYKRPTICDRENILAVSRALQRVEIISGDFENTLNYASSNNTLFYFDPPYKPLSQTSSFNSYSKAEFDDAEQVRLRDFCSELDLLNHTWILSNSDVKGSDPDNSFFDDIYADFNISRVSAKRSINANPEKRGTLSELLITNQKNREEYVRAI